LASSNRACGSADIALSIAAASAAGRSATVLASPGGRPDRIAARVASTLARANGCAPVIAS
jgi:hypothetical protein